jgi:hypothetical protein
MAAVSTAVVDCDCCDGIPNCCPDPAVKMPGRMYFTVTHSYVYNLFGTRYELATCNAKNVGTYAIDYDAATGYWLYQGPSADGLDTLNIVVAIECFNDGTDDWYRAKLVSYSLTVCAFGGGSLTDTSYDSLMCLEDPPPPILFHYVSPTSGPGSLGARVNSNTTPTACCIPAGFIVSAGIDWVVSA